jgi:hypothetical protein
MARSNCNLHCLPGTDAERSVHAGARQLVELIKAINADAERSFAGRAAQTRQDDRQDASDPRDYIAIVRRIDRALQRDYTNADPRHREGFLRALADLLCIVGDRCVPAIEDWDPIAATAAPYRARRARADNKFQRVMATLRR